MAIVTGPNYAGAIGKYLDFKQQQNAMKETIRSNKAREQIARNETAMKMALLKRSGVQREAELGITGSTSENVANIHGQTSRDVAGIRGQTSRDVANIGATSATDVAGIRYDTATDVADINAINNLDAVHLRNEGALDVANVGAENALEVAGIRREAGLEQTQHQVGGAKDVANIRATSATNVANIGATSREKIASIPYEQRKITKAMAEFMGVPGMEGQSINASTEPTLVAKAMDFITFQNVREQQTQKLESDILTTSPPTNIPDWSEMDDVINIDEGTTMESLRGFNTSLSTPDPSNMNATPMKRALIGLKSDDKKHHKYGTDLIKQLETNMKHLINPHLRTAFSGNEGEIQVEKQFTKTTLEQLYTAQGLSADSIKTKLLSWDVKEKEKGDVGAVQSAATKARIKTLTRNYSKHPEGSVQAKRIAKKLKTLGIDVE